MRSFTLSLVAATLMASSALVQAADLVPELEEFLPEFDHVAPADGWYIRGDIGYTTFDVEGVTYFQGALPTGEFEIYDLEESWSFQGGIGYQVTDYFRVDGTLKFIDSAHFDGSSAPAGSVCNGGFGPPTTCSYEDDTELEPATLLMANAYVDLGTINRLTPYIGGGIGGAHVQWGSLLNDQTCNPGAPVGCDTNDLTHEGADQWRFAWALHAGASYDVSCRTKIDAGYTFTRIEGGPMFGDGVDNTGVGGNGGYGFDDGIDMHEGRIGLRYALDGSACHTPSPPMVYK